MHGRSKSRRRKLGAINVVRWGMLRKSFGVTKREKRVKIMSHKMFRDV